MRMLLLFLALLISPSPPPFTATWLRPGVVRLSWQQPADTTRACLARIPAIGAAVALDCLSDIPPLSRVVMLLGSVGPMDASARPAVGDVYVLTMGGHTEQATLMGRLFLPWAGRSGVG